MLWAHKNFNLKFKLADGRYFFFNFKIAISSNSGAGYCNKMMPEPTVNQKECENLNF